MRAVQPESPFSNLSVNRRLKEMLESWCAEQGDKGLPVYSPTNIVNRLMINFLIQQGYEKAGDLRKIEQALIDAARDTHPSPS